jgi:glycosyltransferase involved in cell wall biosynthesis
MDAKETIVAPPRGSYVLVLPWSPGEQGGVTRVVEELRSSFAAQGWLAPIVAVDTWDALVARRSGPVWHLRFALTGVASAAGLAKSIVRIPLVLWRLRRWLRAVDARVVNFHFPALSPLGVLALKRLGLFRGHLILSFHGSDVRPPDDFLERRLRPIVHEGADALVACSASLADRLSSMFRIPRERVRVIHNGVDGSVYRPDAPNVPGLPRLPTAFLLSVGSFNPGKDHATLLRAFQCVVRTYPELELVLAGPDGPGRVRVLDDLTSLGLRHRATVLTGLAPTQVAHLLATCRLCVQPSLSESFPLAILEAGAAGAIVVASRIPGHQEILVEGVSGFMFTPRDSAGCAAAILAALADEKRVRTMANALREHVLTHYTWSRSVDSYRDLTALHTVPRSV